MLIFGTANPDRVLLERSLRDVNAVLFTSAEAASSGGRRLSAPFGAVWAVRHYSSWSAELHVSRLATQHGVSLIAVLDPADAPRAARVRERFGIPGQSVASAVAWSDQVAALHAARASGLDVIPYAAMATPLDLIDFVEARGLPIVVQRRSDPSGRSCRLLRNRDQVDEYLRSSVLVAGRPKRRLWMVKKLAEGVSYSVDGIARAGRMVESWLTQETACDTAPATVLRSAAGMVLTRTDPRTSILRRFASAVVEALPAYPLPMSFKLHVSLVNEQKTILVEAISPGTAAIVSSGDQNKNRAHVGCASVRGQAGKGIIV